MNVLVSIVMAVFFGTSISRRVRLLEKNAELLSSQKPLLEPIAGHDEIAWLDRAFHSMATDLTESAHRLKMLTDNAQDVVCSIDCNGKFVAVNPACIKLWEYSPEELLGRALSDIVDQDDREFVFFEPVDSPGFRDTFSFENKVVSKKGTIVYMMWSAKWSAVQRVFVCIAHCITERKIATQMLQASEARLRTVMESMPAMLLIIGEDGSIKTCNRTCLDMFGYSYAELYQAHIGKLFQSQPVNLLQNLFSNFVDRSGELIAEKKDGDELPVEICLSKISFAADAQFVVLMLDVTERHHIEELRQQFLKLIGIDLKEPISAIHDTLSQLRVGDNCHLNERGKGYIDKAEVETERLVSLVNELLDVEKLRTGSFALEVQPANLQKIVARSIGAVQSLAELGEIVIEMKAPEINVVCDEERLIQVLVNVLSNAIKYSPPSGTILVSVEEDDKWVKIGVTDQGRGIPQSHIETIFEEFAQVEEMDATVKGGIGLGLTICRSIMIQHGGTITVESRPGNTTFWVNLPIANKV